MDESEYAICWKCKINHFNAKGIQHSGTLVAFICDDCGEVSWNFSHTTRTLCHACALKMEICNMCGGRLK